MGMRMPILFIPPTWKVDSNKTRGLSHVPNCEQFEVGSLGGAAIFFNKSYTCGNGDGRSRSEGMDVTGQLYSMGKSQIFLWAGRPVH